MSNRVPVPDRPEPKKFNAPLLAGAVVAVGLIVVLLINVFGSREKLTVDDLNSPAVAALDGGSAVYPANSKLAFTENAKFGYLPAPTLAELGDGTIVAADPKTAPKLMGLDGGLDTLDREAFLERTITAPREGNAAGETITWDETVEAFAGSTVLMPLIETAEVADPALATIAEAGAEKSTIVRTSNPEVADAAAEAGVAALFTGDATASTPDGNFGSEGFTMIAIDASHAAKWTGTDLKVWATGVKDKKQLDELAEAGVFGALSTNPYAIQPSAVKTD
ncbi:hypothetical protein DFO66_11251 [Brevibacterium sanguinis]|uniref:Glycerophosphoryl diester phosphodiesterase family protein n=2 Tax=Brevibacterium TaxID=1696 RepID=A0A366IE93_9MICO|nr:MULTISPECIES: hypothetical protein [Brevibacterium]RBP62947.1 hypothetical protein DFO66_11251 [Brevibacterium sanguinis]RBP69508.1 hypothetical protein DFO65_11242 [Brevibacterium celere]